MNSPLVARVFFAIDLPISVKEKIGDYIGELKRKSKSSAIRWSRPENLHITLQFLPQVKVTDLPNLVRGVREKIAAFDKESTFTFRAVHLFPNPFRPRVIVQDIKPQTEMVLLSRLIGEGIQEAQYEIETRPFRAHLTLGRIKQPHGMNLHFLSEVPRIEMAPLSFNEVVLFQSEPEEDGSRYSVIERFPLGVRRASEEWGT